MKNLRLKVALVCLVFLLIACENSLVDKAAPSITNFSVTSEEIALGESTTLFWTIASGNENSESSSDGLRVQLNGQFYPSEATMSVQPEVDTTYTLNAFNSIAEVSKSIRVKVIAPSTSPVISEPTPIEPITDPAPVIPNPNSAPFPITPEPIGLPAKITDGIYSIANIESNLCVDVPPYQQSINKTVIQWDCHYGQNQQWLLTKESDYYKLIVQNNNQLLTRGLDGSVEFQPQLNTDSQYWKLLQTPNGIRIVSKIDNTCLSIESIDEDNYELLLTDCDASDTQVFIFKKHLVDEEIVSQTSHKGQWSDKIEFPIVPVAASVLPNNKVLMWSSFDALRFVGSNGNTQTALYDLSSQTIEHHEISIGHDMFCPGISMLADGQVLVNGGSNNLKTSLYNYLGNTWSISGDMSIDRGYNTSVTLNNGEVFTLGGSWGSQGALEKVGEVWNSTSQTWATLADAKTTPLFAANDPQFDQHPQLFAAPNGNVFLAGPTPNLTWYDLTGSGIVIPAGQRADDEHSQVGITAMYDVGKILKAGGASRYTANAPATNKSYVIDINNPDNVVVEKVSAMNYARAFASSVILPDGQVMVTGGSTVAKTFDDSFAVMTPELWNPVTGEWRELEPHTIPRTYHSLALLLPDATVLAAGGGLCGDCDVNHPDGEIYSPAYLFTSEDTLAPRPEILDAPSTLSYDESFEVQTSEEVTAFSLVRMSSITHSVNTDQRFIKLAAVVEVEDETGGSYNLKAPSNNIAPPGYWMLFAFNAEGVPSIAKIINISAD